MLRKTTTVAAAGALLVSAGAYGAGSELGLAAERLLSELSMRWFGIGEPLDGEWGVDVPRAPGQRATDRVALARGLRAEIVTRQAGAIADMFAFWPNDTAPTHLIFCIEGGRQDLGVTLPGAGGLSKLNPGVQRIELDTGKVSTILRGTAACDPARRTPWGTIVIGEETSDGGLYEIIDPLHTDDHTITSRAAGTVVDRNGQPSQNVVKRSALPVIAWEGLDITPAGVVIAGDELRPGTGTPDRDGGAIFKFIPARPHAGGAITSLAQSPFVAGSIHAFRAACSLSSAGAVSQWGQGCETGMGDWVSVAAATARTDADAAGATGYYRPEDGHFDPTYKGPGVKFCWANTGNESVQNWSETVCLIDEEPGSAMSRPVAQRFVEGHEELSSMDNLAFQPHTGIVYLLEDRDFGDVWACLPDGADRDLKSDGCVRVLAVKDADAEPTGLAFDASGRTAYLSIQHPDNAACTAGTDCQPVDGYPTTDIVRITGFRIPPGMAK